MEKKTLISVIANLEELFEIFNKRYFNNELEKPVISVSPDKNLKSYGHCTTYKAWEDDTQGYYEINMTAEFLNRTLGEICGTLIHEMVHLYNLTNNVKDVTNGYHNKKFKDEAEKRGLIIAKNKYGWSETSLSEELEEFVKTLDYNFVIYRKPISKTKKTKKNPTLKYVCPCCGTKIYSIKELNVKCEDCGEYFEQY